MKDLGMQKVTLIHTDRDAVDFQSWKKKGWKLSPVYGNKTGLGGAREKKSQPDLHFELTFVKEEDEPDLSRLGTQSEDAGLAEHDPHLAPTLSEEEKQQQ